jgi:hypothetical protein
MLNPSIWINGYKEGADSGTDRQCHRETVGQGDKGTVGQRDRGAVRQRDRGTEGQMDRGTEGQRDSATEGPRDREVDGQSDGSDRVTQRFWNTATERSTEAQQHAPPRRDQSRQSRRYPRPSPLRAGRPPPHWVRMSGSPLPREGRRARRGA